VIVVGKGLKVSGKSGLSGFRDCGRRIDDDNDHDDDEETSIPRSARRNPSDIS
jgi:hypothetical protein